MIGIFMSVGQTKDSSENLLYIYRGCLVCHGSKNVSKRTVPAFFQRVDRNNKTDRARGRHQIHVFQFVLICRLDGNLFLGNTEIHQLLFDFVKGRAFSTHFRLCLEQYDRTDISAGLLLFLDSRGFQFHANTDSIAEHIGLRFAVIYDNGKLYHIFFLQRGRINERYNVATFFRCSGEIQHKAWIEIIKHLNTQIRCCVVTFVNDNHGVELTHYLNQRRFIGIFQQNLGVGIIFCKCGEIAVLLICLAPVLFTRAEGIITQYEYRELFRYGCRIEILTVQKLLFGVHLYTAAKFHVELLAVRMISRRKSR